MSYLPGKGYRAARMARNLPTQRDMVVVADSGGCSDLTTLDCRAEKLKQAPMRKIPTKNM